LARLAFLLSAFAFTAPAVAADQCGVAWWVWPLALFAVSFAIGVIAVVAGVGGGVLFVPIVSSFFPFHLDFVRSAGLLLALSGALSAGPALLRSGLASLRLAMPLALVGSITSIAGAILGLALPTEFVQSALGVTILGLVALLARMPRGANRDPAQSDRLARLFGIHGRYHDSASGRDIEWSVQRTPAGLVAFGGIGFLAGMFGLGAGWANVPVLHLLMGAPLKLSVGTSGLVLSVIDTSAAWVYLNSGAVLPILVAPSVIGVMLGAKLGVRALRRAPARLVRRLVLMLLVVAGMHALLKGLALWN
jgi:uncharacterized membrane protein YfcA